MGKDIRHVIMNGELTVDCKGCQRSPDLASKECLGCVISGMGASEVRSIVLRTLKDRKYVGKIVSVMNGLCMMDSSARSAMRWNNKGKCSGCPCSPNSVIGIAWGSFPSPDIGSARSAVHEYEAQDGRCEECMISTCRMLDHIEFQISDIQRNALSGGVI